MKKLHFISLLLFCLIHSCEFTHSQDKATIIKKCFSSKTESFPSREYTCQKIIIKNEQIVYKIIYSYNGWQILDSITYEIKGNQTCIKSHFPIYEPSTLLLKEYQPNATKCFNRNDFQIEIKDKFGLSEEFITPIYFLLSQQPVKSNETFRFSKDLAPSLFTQYGISYNEQLMSFQFKIKDGLLYDDRFEFENYTLTRKYSYAEQVLNKVDIHLFNTKGDTLSEFTEIFNFNH